MIEHETLFKEVHFGDEEDKKADSKKKSCKRNERVCVDVTRADFALNTPHVKVTRVGYCLTFTDLTASLSVIISALFGAVPQRLRPARITSWQKRGR